MPKYLYCIVPCEDEFSPVRVPRLQNGPELSLVTATSVGLSVVVSNLPAPLSNGNREKLLEHHEIVSAVMINNDVVPLHFGTVAQNDQEIFQLLEQGGKKLKEILQMVQGKVEYTLSASWKDSQVIQDIAMQNPMISEARTRVASRGTPPSMEEAIAIGKMIQEELSRRNRKLVEKAKEMLQTLGAAMVPLPLESEKSIFTVAILLKRVYDDNFRDVVKILQRIFGGGVVWQCNGPLPPYHFIDGRFELLTKSAIEEACQELGLSKKFSVQELKEAYRQKARETHPDQNPTDSAAQERFGKIESAYRLLRKTITSSEEVREETGDFLLRFDQSPDGERLGT